MIYDFRDGDEKLIDEQQDVHDLHHTDNPDPKCWLCQEKASHLCRCGHDREDEHRIFNNDELMPKHLRGQGVNVRMCDECLGDCVTVVGEREDFEAKTAEINAKAKPKVEAEVQKYLEGAPWSHIEPKK